MPLNGRCIAKKLQLLPIKVSIKHVCMSLMFISFAVPPSPKNVLVHRINSTTVNITWEKQTLVELKGLANYNIEISYSKKRQLFKTFVVPWTKNHLVISNLTQGVDYNIFVTTSTSVGMSGMFSY